MSYRKAFLTNINIYIREYLKWLGLFLGEEQPIQVYRGEGYRDALRLVNTKVDNMITQESNRIYFRKSGFSRQDDKQQQDVQQEGNYDFSHPYRGLAIVISQENFTVPGNERRPYAQTEIKNMREAFTLLGFHVVCFTDLTCTQMMDVLKRAAAVDLHSYSDCFVCVIGSHGNEIPSSSSVDKKANAVVHEQVVYGADGPIQLKKLVDLFSDQQCPKLSKKPKMFFIQACRSRMGVTKDQTLDKGVTVEIKANKPQSSGQTLNKDVSVETKENKAQTSDKTLNKGTTVETKANKPQPSNQTSDGVTFETKANDPQPSDQSDINEGKGILDTLKNLFRPSQQIPLIEPACPVCPNDFLIMYSTPTEHYSFAKDKDGGWMIRCLYLGLSQTSATLCNGNIDLLTLLTMVIKLGAQCFEVNIPGGPEHGSKSAFVLEHKLTDEIFFKRK